MNILFPQSSTNFWPRCFYPSGSHGRNNGLRFLLGSVAEFVARQANYSVEIVRASAVRRR